MKVFLLLAVCLLSLHNGTGAKRNSFYQFVRCNPGSGDANCVSQRTKEVEWSPDLPAKLPASTAQYLEAEPVEDESPAWREEEVMEEEDDEYEEQQKDVGDKELEVEEEEEEEEENEDELDDKNESPEMEEEEGESPLSPPSEEGSGVYEGSTEEGSVDVPAESGSGESWTEKELYRAGDRSSLRRLLRSRSLVVKAKPEDFKQDQILQL